MAFACYRCKFILSTSLNPRRNSISLLFSTTSSSSLPSSLLARLAVVSDKQIDSYCDGLLGIASSASVRIDNVNLLVPSSLPHADYDGLFLFVVDRYDLKSAVSKVQNAVLNLTEMEAKTREATNDDKWSVIVPLALVCDAVVVAYTFVDMNVYVLMLERMTNRGASSTLMKEISDATFNL